MIDHGSTLDGVRHSTSRQDNTRVQRIKALKVLTDQGFALHEAADLLGIESDWVTTPDPEPVQVELRGKRWKRSHYNGPARM